MYDHRDLRKDRKRQTWTGMYLIIRSRNQCLLYGYCCSNRSFCRADTSNRNNGHRDTCAHDTSIIRPCVGGDSGGYDDDVTMTFLCAIRHKRDEENHWMEREETTRVSGKGHGHLTGGGRGGRGGNNGLRGKFRSFTRGSFFRTFGDFGSRKVRHLLQSKSRHSTVV